MLNRIEDLGFIVKQFREKRGLTQDALTDICGLDSRTPLAHLEQGRRVPRPEVLQKIASELGLPGPLWESFAQDESRQRHEFEATISELLGRPITLRVPHQESVRAAENAIRSLFGRNLTPTQAFDLFNSALIFYGVPRMHRAFFDRYFSAGSFQDTTTFETAIRTFQKDAIRLFSTFAEAYRRLNSAPAITEILQPLEPRSTKAYEERTAWEHPDDPDLRDRDPIQAVPEDKLIYLGYISVQKYREQRLRRETLTRYLRQLATAIREKGKVAVDELGEKRRRKLDSLLHELDSSLAHTPISSLFVPNPAELEAEAGRILRSEEDEAEMEATQSRALENLSNYVSADYMDVYVATSMRTRSDFVSVNRFVSSLFSNPSLAPLRLRYFNPTQSWIEDRVAKGLVEALMLRRADMAVYMAQKTDTFGKDSEASVALGQGKPVVVYVPRLMLASASLDSAILAKETDSRLRRIILDGDANTTTEDLDDLDHGALFAQALGVQLEKISDTQIHAVVRNHWPDFALLDETERITGEDEIRRRDEYTTWLEQAIESTSAGEIPSRVKRDLLEILVAVTVNFEKRATVFREVHPLALQVILSSGVLNGILVARSVESCAQLVNALVKNSLELELAVDSDNYRLIERTTGSTIRVISRNMLLVNALDNLYGRLT